MLQITFENDFDIDDAADFVEFTYESSLAFVNFNYLYLLTIFDLFYIALTSSDKSVNHGWDRIWFEFSLLNGSFFKRLFTKFLAASDTSCQISLLS